MPIRAPCIRQCSVRSRDTVHEAEDGADALGKAISLQPALIVSETQLHRIDGFALCRLLRADPSTRRARIIVVTSMANPVDAVRALKAGADRVLVKPCPPETLVDAALELCTAAGDQPGSVPPAAAPRPAADAFAAPRRLRSRTFRREQTTTPPVAPPPLHCPACDSLLVYEHSHIGGVNERSPEQWDYFRCPQCGPYRYRHRTRKLKIA